MQKIGLFAWYGFLLPLQERLRLISEAGFTHVSLWWGEEFTETDGPIRYHPDMARQIGLEIDSAHLPYQDANSLWTDSLAGDAFFRHLLELVRSCGEHRIPVAVLHPNGGPEPPPFSGIGFDRIRRLVEEAEKSDTVLALENLHVTTILDTLFESIPSKNLGFCYDSGHDRIFATPGRDLLSLFGHRLVALHLHDNLGTHDLHGLPGEGDISWAFLVARIRQTGYEGVWSLESMKEYNASDPSMTGMKEYNESDPSTIGMNNASDPSTMDLTVQARKWLSTARCALQRCMKKNALQGTLQGTLQDTLQGTLQDTLQDTFTSQNT